MPEPQKSAVYAVADKLTPRLRRQWLAAVAKLQDGVTLDMLSEAILQGGFSTRVFRALDRFPEELKAAIATIAHVFEQSASRAEQEIVTRLQLVGVFDIVNPRAVEAAQLHGAQLVREVTEDVKSAIRSVISRSVRDGIAPRDAAKLIRPLVGLTERQSIAVVNYRASLLDAGAKAEKVQAAAARYAAKLHRSRADLISRTEVIRAANSGQQAAWEAAQAEGLIAPDQMKRWLAAPGERTCPTCLALDGQTVDLRGQFQSLIGPVTAPPSHPACRCGMALVFEKRKAA